MKNIKTFESFVNEKAIPFDEILKDETKQGIIVKDTNVRGITKSLLLYDFDDKKVLAFAQIRKWNKNDKYWRIDMTAAEKDYGPDLYDLSLMSVYPEPIKPSSTIKPAAQKVWKYYSENRPDVTKKPIGEDEDEYSIEYESYENGKPVDKNDPETLSVINTWYSLEPSDVFDKLIKRGEEYSETYKVTSAKLFADAKSYFWNMYDNK